MHGNILRVDVSMRRTPMQNAALAGRGAAHLGRAEEGSTMCSAPSHSQPRESPASEEPALDGTVRPDVLRFLDFEFDTAREQLRRNGVPVPLSPKPAALLRYFLEHPERLIGKQELMAHIWGGVVVTDDSLVQCVGELRSRLGEPGGRLITTHPRRGYMFDAPVQAVSRRNGAASNPAPEPTLEPPPERALERPLEASPNAGALGGRLGRFGAWVWRPRVALAAVALGLALVSVGGYIQSRPGP